MAGLQAAGPQLIRAVVFLNEFTDRLLELLGQDQIRNSVFRRYLCHKWPRAVYRRRCTQGRRLAIGVLFQLRQKTVSKNRMVLGSLVCRQRFDSLLHLRFVAARRCPD
jgi:hypothetical protein